MTDNPDEIYGKRQKQVKAFEFDEKVSNVFPDMIKRSVPGYEMIISMISMLTEKHYIEGTACYDLGCSLGASTFAINEGLKCRNADIYAVDNSEAMITNLESKLSEFRTGNNIIPVCGDIKEIEFKPASVVVMNFTLQFIRPDKRLDLLKKIAQNTVDGGIIILSEKLKFENEPEDEHLFNWHHDFKRYHGYSNLEISQKRTALENVLIPETFDVHKYRLMEAGYKEVYKWFQCFNFSSLLAIK